MPIDNEYIKTPPAGYEPTKWDLIAFATFRARDNIANSQWSEKLPRAEEDTESLDYLAYELASETGRTARTASVGWLIM